MHTHLAGISADPAWSKNVLLPLLVANGITGIRDMGGDLRALQEWRREIASGALLGPQIVAAGPMLVPAPPPGKAKSPDPSDSRSGQFRRSPCGCDRAAETRRRLHQSDSTLARSVFRGRRRIEKRRHHFRRPHSHSRHRQRSLAPPARKASSTSSTVRSRWTAQARMPTCAAACWRPPRKKTTPTPQCTTTRTKLFRRRKPRRCGPPSIEMAPGSRPRFTPSQCGHAPQQSPDDPLLAYFRSRCKKNGVQQVRLRKENWQTPPGGSGSMKMTAS